MSESIGRSAWGGIDLGTQSVRVAFFDDDGTLLASASRPLHSVRSPGRHEQDPGQWLSAVREMLVETTAVVSASGHVVQAIALSGTSGTIVPVDATGAPVAAAVMYDDARGETSLAATHRAGADLWTRSGYRPQASWALPCLVSMIADRSWPTGALLAHQPDVIAAYLTGGRVPADTSHALKTGADLFSAHWPVALFGELGVDTAVLPALVLPGEPVGEVSTSAAAETGLPAGALIVAGMTDGCAAQIASGALDEGEWNVVLGTTLVIKGTASEPQPDPTGAVYSHRAPFGAGWWPGGASSTGAGAISHWLPGADLDALTGEAAARGVPADFSYPLSGRGERFPFVAPAAEGFLFADPTDESGRLCDIAYGVAAIERLSFDLLDLCGYDVSGRVYSTGGGSRNTWWVRVRADMLGRDLVLPEQRDGAIGMAVLARAGFDHRALADVAREMLGASVVVRCDDAADLRTPYLRFVARLEHDGLLDAALADHARSRAAAWR